MNKKVDRDGYELEPLGSCMTNTQQDSQDIQKVEPRYLWSYAQEAALLALCEENPDKSWALLEDTERRVKRIAACYAKLYFDSAKKSKGKIQFYWPALAAFVVKDIVGALQYTREKVLQSGWSNLARNSTVSQISSLTKSEASPYEHAMRVYLALVKGNLWLFMDIYPWLWFFLEYGINRDGSLNVERLKTHVEARDSDELQDQSRNALNDLHFGQAWLARQQAWQKADPVYRAAQSFFTSHPIWTGSGYGDHAAKATQAHSYVKKNIAGNGYHFLGTSAKKHWPKFSEAFYVLEAERREFARISQDAAALGKLQKAAKFKPTQEIREAYKLLISEKIAEDDNELSNIRLKELKTIAKHEQLNILQPVTYEDHELIKTMDLNHWISRSSSGFLSPKYCVIYSSAFETKDPKLQTVFDKPEGAWDQTKGALGAKLKSLPNKKDRMKYVGRIADDFHRLMQEDRSYMDSELKKIQGWLHA